MPYFMYITLYIFFILYISHSIYILIFVYSILYKNIGFLLKFIVCIYNNLSINFLKPI